MPTPERLIPLLMAVAGLIVLALYLVVPELARFPGRRLIPPGSKSLLPRAGLAAGAIVNRPPSNRAATLPIRRPSPAGPSSRRKPRRPATTTAPIRP